MNKVERPVKAGLYLALGTALHLLETSIFPLGAILPLPGVRIGLANLVGLVVLATEGPVLAIFVTLGRILLGSLFSGTFLGLPFFMGLGGGIAAIVVMALCRSWVPSRLSWVGLSVLGALFHNLGQLSILYFSLPSVGLITYLPWMIFLSVPSGIIVGTVGSQVIHRLKNVSGNPRENGEEK